MNLDLCALGTCRYTPNAYILKVMHYKKKTYFSIKPYTLTRFVSGDVWYVLIANYEFLGIDDTFKTSLTHKVSIGL